MPGSIVGIAGLDEHVLKSVTLSRSASSSDVGRACWHLCFKLTLLGLFFFFFFFFLLVAHQCARR